MPIEPVTVTPSILGTYDTNPSDTLGALDQAAGISGGSNVWQSILIVGAVVLAAYFIFR